MRHDQIKETGITDVGVLMLGDDEEIGGQRHQLPQHQEEEAVVGHHDEGHGENKGVVQRPKDADRSPAVELAHIAERIQGDSQRGD
ncbi:MAG: hypothetical protein C4294_14850 [Nitrospiraceae bacterium]